MTRRTTRDAGLAHQYWKRYYTLEEVDEILASSETTTIISDGLPIHVRIYPQPHAAPTLIVSHGLITYGLSPGTRCPIGRRATTRHVPELTIWYRRRDESCVWGGMQDIVPRHVLTLTVIVIALFALVWFGVFVLGQSPNRSLLASVLTIVLFGVGVSYSLSTLREDKRNRD